MQSFRHSALSSRVAPKLKSVHPKDKIKQWNIVTGDKVNLQPFLSFYSYSHVVQVAIIAGKDKDTIGEVKSVDRKNNTLIIEGKKLV